MAFRFGTRSERFLGEVHPDLARVMRKALSLSEIDFAVTEGRRTNARQKRLVAAGASRTLNSRHLTGHAVDVVPFIDGQARWDWPLFHRLALAVSEAARLEQVPIIWGGNWRTFKDGPHFELERKAYP
jgi:peptidoglycan LD-endopeptidase CwlK